MSSEISFPEKALTDSGSRADAKYLKLPAQKWIITCEKLASSIDNRLRGELTCLKLQIENSRIDFCLENVKTYLEDKHRQAGI
jgi:hypothetical protein